ncbi:MAG: histidine kinase [Oscillospiraceae bacterium]|nr:histidine kinase [Oscillospiraceae bacterium]
MNEPFSGRRIGIAACALMAVMAAAAVALLVLGSSAGTRLIAAALLLVAGAAFLLFQFGIRPKLVQHDMAVNTLLTLSDRGEDGEERLVLPPLNVLLDEVISQQRAKYQMMLSQDRNSLMVLQNQINPHFLYNTLDCIRGEALESEMDDIASMVESLSTFFRYSISSGDILVQLRDELRNIQIYYQIQKYRFKDRFRMEIECEDDRALDCYLPKLTLQPIMENCILHGLEMTEADGLILIHVCLTDQRLIITVSDNGCGMTPNELAQLREKINSELPPASERGMVRHGLAIQNINKQLKLIFGQGYGLYVSSQVGEGTEVELQIPAVFRRRDLTLRGERL